MEPVSEEKDKALKEELEDRFSARNPREREGMDNKMTRWGSGRIDHEERLIFNREKISDDSEQIISSVSEFITELNFEELYSVAYEDEQYSSLEKSFEEKFDNKSAVIKPSEIPEIRNYLIEVLIVPESLDWVILFDHEGDISFNGSQEFIEEVKDFFGDWEELSEFPDRRNFGRQD